MNNFTKLMMLLSTLVLLIGGGFSFYLTYQGNQPVTVINMGEAGVAIEGFDTVSYHTISTAQKGVHNFQVTWRGAIWYFSSLENRQIFSETPEEYAPQYGGYDALGMAMNGTIQAATPELWAIVDGRLFLFHSGRTRNLWQENEPENQEKADIQWAKIKQQIHYKKEMK
ncbi:hypothetical protein MNBD_ALPHA03-307 [hydrothermal vent metagenome]|uniref:YHS domain-containing protein n=1 Tax=hydrothermal vent metagenome TaxID=652676 RepID=A0A3B1B7G1_9ZZZZ